MRQGSHHLSLHQSRATNSWSCQSLTEQFSERHKPRHRRELREVVSERQEGLAESRHQLRQGHVLPHAFYFDICWHHSTDCQPSCQTGERVRRSGSSWFVPRSREGRLVAAEDRARSSKQGLKANVSAKNYKVAVAEEELVGGAVVGGASRDSKVAGAVSLRSRLCCFLAYTKIPVRFSDTSLGKVLPWCFVRSIPRPGTSK